MDSVIKRSGPHGFCVRAPVKTYLAALGLAAVMQGCESGGDSNEAAAAQARAQLVAALSAQADRWDQAIVRKDRAAIESNMAADFRQIDGQGALGTLCKTPAGRGGNFAGCWPRRGPPPRLVSGQGL